MNEERGITITSDNCRSVARVGRFVEDAHIASDLNGVNIVLLDNDEEISLDIAQHLRDNGAVVAIYGAGDIYHNEKAKISRLIEDIVAATEYNQKDRDNFPFAVKNERFVSPKHKYNTPRWQR